MKASLFIFFSVLLSIASFSQNDTLIFNNKFSEGTVVFEDKIDSSRLFHYYPYLFINKETNEPVTGNIIIYGKGGFGFYKVKNGTPSGINLFYDNHNRLEIIEITDPFDKWHMTLNFNKKGKITEIYLNFRIIEYVSLKIKKNNYFFNDNNIYKLKSNYISCQILNFLETPIELGIISENLVFDKNFAFTELEIANILRNK